jgi:hypothetical protein
MNDRKQVSRKTYDKNVKSEKWAEIREPSQMRIDDVSLYYTGSERNRGELQFDHDGKSWAYRKPSGASLRQFKNAVLAAFEQDSRAVMRLSGRYPFYRIESH